MPGLSGQTGLVATAHASLVVQRLEVRGGGELPAKVVRCFSRIPETLTRIHLV